MDEYGQVWSSILSSPSYSIIQFKIIIIIIIILNYKFNMRVIIGQVDHILGFPQIPSYLMIFTKHGHACNRRARLRYNT